MICSWDPPPENCLFYTGTAMVMVMSNECVREHAQVRGGGGLWAHSKLQKRMEKVLSYFRYQKL